MFKKVSRTVSVIALIAILLVACTPPALQPQTPRPLRRQLRPPRSPRPKPPLLPKAALLLPEPIGALARKSFSSPADQRAAALRPSSITARSPRPRIRARMWNTCGPTGILRKMTSQFTQAMATKPDGIAVMGHPGDAAFGPLIDEAEIQGIIVTSMNTQLPETQAKYSSKGFGYVGAVLYNAGYSLGEQAVKRSGAKSGDKAFLWGLLAQAGRGERTKGVKDALEKAGLKVIYQEIDDAVNKSPASGVPVFTGIMSANPDIKLMVTDHGNLTGTVQTFLEAAGKKPGEVYAAGFDMSGNAIEAIRGGWLQLVIDQQQYLQGYFGVLQICLTKNYGFAGLQIDTGAGFADKDNVEQLAGLVQKQIR